LEASVVRREAAVLLHDNRGWLHDDSFPCNHSNSTTNAATNPSSNTTATEATTKTSPSTPSAER